MNKKNICSIEKVSTLIWCQNRGYLQCQKLTNNRGNTHFLLLKVGGSERVSGLEAVRKFNSETLLLLSQLLLDSTLCGSLLHTANMDLKVIVVFALMAVVIHAPVSNGELLFNRYFANVYIIFALCIKLRCVLTHYWATMQFRS